MVKDCILTGRFHGSWRMTTRNRFGEKRTKKKIRERERKMPILDV
jgi:hypothetical protein